jgi:pimeloyl-ACP methyl ester carboxylesterase
VQVTRSEFKSSGVTLPFVKISTEAPIGDVIIIHGFGGCKEEQLGLSFRLAEFGLDAYTVDLRGHGQNVQPLNIEILGDVNTLVRSLKGIRRTITVGHSLGGRLSLLSDAI